QLRAPNSPRERPSRFANTSAPRPPSNQTSRPRQPSEYCASKTAGSPGRRARAKTPAENPGPPANPCLQPSATTLLLSYRDRSSIPEYQLPAAESFFDLLG